MCVGWGGRIRTYGTRYQKPMPYHLATPQREGLITLTLIRVQDPFLKKNDRFRVSGHHSLTSSGLTPQSAVLGAQPR